MMILPINYLIENVRHNLSVQLYIVGGYINQYISLVQTKFSLLKLYIADQK